MNTQFDFVSSVNGVMFLLSLAFIGGYIVLNELMRPEPFRAFVRALRSDWQEIRAEGFGRLMEIAKGVVSAPVYVAMYVVSVPVLFVVGLVMPIGKAVSVATSFGWSPVRAYFRGKKALKKKDIKTADQ